METLPGNNPWLIAALVSYGLFSLVVSIGLARDSSLSTGQKLWQMLVAWLIPFVGGALMLAWQGHHHPRAEMKSLVPFPFYLAGYRDTSDKMNPDRYGHDDGVSGFSPGGGEGSCGGD